MIALETRVTCRLHDCCSPLKWFQLHATVILSQAMLEQLPLDITSRILELLVTRQQLQLKLVCKAWQETCNHKNDRRQITIATTKERVDEAVRWLRYLDDHTYLTVHDLALTVKESFIRSGDYDSNIGRQSYLNCNYIFKIVSYTKHFFRPHCALLMTCLHSSFNAQCHQFNATISSRPSYNVYKSALQQKKTLA